MIKSLIKGDCDRKFSGEATLALKGLCAVGIILHHLPSFADSITMPTYVKYLYGFIISCIGFGNSIVPVFFFISGYGLTSSYLLKGQSYLDSFFKKRIFRLLLPFAAGILIFQIFSIINGNTFEFNAIISGLAKGDTERLLPYCWYVFSIFVFYSVFYFVFRNGKNMNRKIIALSVISILYIIILRFANFGMWWYVHVPAFCLGCFWRFKENEIILFLKGGQYRFITVLSLLLSAVACLTFTYLAINFLSEYCLGLLSLIYPAIIVLVMYNVKIPCPFLFNNLGKISYEFYILQGVAICFLRGNHIFIQSSAVYICDCIACTFMLAWVAHKINSFILKQ